MGQKEKNTPFSINLMGSPVLYWAAQGKEEASEHNKLATLTRKMH